MSPKVSVIIPTYNRASVLNRAIDSVLGQTFKDWELIIVDDGSTDETSELLQSHSHESLSIYRTSNQGVSAARNLGLQKAHGEWVAFLDSDDEWLPEKLAKQMAYAEAHPDILIVHGEEIWVRNGVRVNPMKKHQKRGGDIFGDAVKLCCISPSTVLLKKSLLLDLGGFREDYPVCEDYDLWLKITCKHPVGFIEDFLIKKYGGHEDQLSRKYFAMDYWRVKSLSHILGELKNDLNKYEVAQKELNKKSNVLLKGYRKHQNLENYQEVFEFLK